MWKRPYNEDSELNAVNIICSRLQSLENVDPPLFLKVELWQEKRGDMMDLLKFIPPAKHDYYKNLTANRNDESSHTADEEDIIYIAYELITNNITGRKL